MTSKALEAAALACRNFDRSKPVRVTAGESYEVEQSKLLAADIIRAFAQNISEEASDECEVSWSGCHYHCQGITSPTPKQILRAIEKDLE